MTIVLQPEQRQRLAALLAYCREMGGVDFYRSREEAAEAARASLASAAGFGADSHASPATVSTSDVLPDSAGLETLSMPKKTTISAASSTQPPALTLAPPPIIDFSSPAVPPGEREAALQAIRDDIGDCTRCPLAFAGRNKIVFGNGDPNAELFFVGEGPGAEEDLQGLPFVGRGGQLLNNMIAAMGLSREQVYVANIVKCRPPKNRVPEPVEALTCSQFLFRQIAVVRPKLIVALGSTAATYLTGARSALSVLRGRVLDCMGTKLVVTYHPAYLLRDPRQKAEAWKDLQLAMKFLNLPVPKRSKG